MLFECYYFEYIQENTSPYKKNIKYKNYINKNIYYIYLFRLLCLFFLLQLSVNI